MTRTLSPETLTSVHRVWARRLGAPTSVFDGGETSFVTRPDLTATVVVRLGGATVVAAPDHALSDLRPLVLHELVDVPSLVTALQSHGASVIGEASLSFADHFTVSPAAHAPLDGAVRVALGADADAVLSMCSDDERDESGLDRMTSRLVATGRSGEPVALAGHEVWDDALAQLGLAVAPGCRGQGFGKVAAGAAALQAIRGGRVAQWRCRAGNLASERVRDRVGFVPLGTQIAIDLAPARP